MHSVTAAQTRVPKFTRHCPPLSFFTFCSTSSHPSPLKLPMSVDLGARWARGVHVPGCSLSETVMSSSPSSLPLGWPSWETSMRSTPAPPGYPLPPRSRTLLNSKSVNRTGNPTATILFTCLSHRPSKAGRSNLKRTSASVHHSPYPPRPPSLRRALIQHHLSQKRVSSLTPGLVS